MFVLASDSSFASGPLFIQSRLSRDVSELIIDFEVSDALPENPELNEITNSIKEGSLIFFNGLQTCRFSEILLSGCN